MTQNYESWVTSKLFWTDTLERVLRTTAQSAVAVLTTPVLTASAGLEASIPWEAMLITVAGTALLTFLTCVAGRGVGDRSTASLTAGTMTTPLPGPRP